MMLGPDGLTRATIYAILNANYISASLKNWYKTLYTGTTGFVAHELILDCRNFKAEAVSLNQILQNGYGLRISCPNSLFSGTWYPDG
jgi:glycine dehydrogenase